ncbi:YqgE/AlgH family protein [Oceanomicrobium pacificus]|uniref:UPF0301 protein GSH16_15240 n=1 Tax=Oceanomicrobium pacificus TaxID=2692916 RepID=A0A6B0U0N9_9RHOB|nr:YqgE/AlgH family protein [Oceanomicrobium pacificus]MXU66803.1 YqgE/AlgH family protein [Oceanomicrobium pacificus]
MSADQQEPGFLDGKLLVAMPGMGDSRFDHTVIFICAHSPEGAMGLVINKPAPDLKFKDLLDQLDIPGTGSARELRVHLGGPVEHGRGFVLHTPEYHVDQSTMDIDGLFGMTATLEVLRDIAGGEGPERSLLALGYAGWGPGQLESELQANGWLTCDADLDLVFNDDDDEKWQAALALLGVDPRMLSAEGGTA